MASGASISKPISFAELAAIPRWLNWPEEEQTSLAIVAAILHHADAMVRELSGEKLRSLAMATGSDLFDYIAEHYFDAALQLMPTQSPPSKLPRPEDLEALGRNLLMRSLPLALETQYPGASNDQHGRQIADLAYSIITAFEACIAASHTQEPGK